MDNKKECRLTKAIDRINSLDENIFDLQRCLKKAKRLLNSKQKDDKIVSEKNN
tara:strand:- start:204 stop:362 length:159 start_codon:yes stop_codon:yes gene_type:complete